MTRMISHKISSSGITQQNYDCFLHNQNNLENHNHKTWQSLQRTLTRTLDRSFITRDRSNFVFWTPVSTAAEWFTAMTVHVLSSIHLKLQKEKKRIEYLEYICWWMPFCSVAEKTKQNKTCESCFDIILSQESDTKERYYSHHWPEDYKSKKRNLLAQEVNSS